MNFYFKKMSLTLNFLFDARKGLKWTDAHLMLSVLLQKN